MHDIIDRLAAWHGSGQPFALATVVRTWSSSPRQSGASMAVNAAGEVVGSVSGGCVEGAVYEVAREVLATGIPRGVTYGVSNDDAFAVGLTCGGSRVHRRGGHRAAERWQRTAAARHGLGDPPPEPDSPTSPRQPSSDRRPRHQRRSNDKELT